MRHDCARVCVYVRGCVHVCMCACARVCMRARGGRACVCMGMYVRVLRVCACIRGGLVTRGRESEAPRGTLAPGGESEAPRGTLAQGRERERRLGAPELNRREGLEAPRPTRGS